MRAVFQLCIVYSCDKKYFRHTSGRDYSTWNSSRNCL